MRTGRRSLLAAGPVSLAFVLPGLTGVTGIVMVATGTNRGESSGPGIAGLVVMLVFGALGVLFGIPIRMNRHTAVAVDARGVWLLNGRERQVVPWAGPAGVGVYWSRLGTRRGAKHGRPGPDRPWAVRFAEIRTERPLVPLL
ncbi:hypothetical protein [Streptomyces meridianus]|uniref:PH domain-containing protein n=1 Tax=Streptomyces meridianus TaxID=2938945 RepID=A0ABT0XC88_9ACTN|nr:hypothetical protein [Streptomyces meridianus]MCM2580137.1 hypothetical protein [Streptomyces meridianus]